MRNTYRGSTGKPEQQKPLGRPREIILEWIFKEIVRQNVD